jgi:transposase
MFVNREICFSIKDSGLSDRKAAKVFNITRATAAKWLKRDDEMTAHIRAHTLHTTLTAPQEAVVLSLRQTLCLPRDDLLFINRQYIDPEVSRSGIARPLKREGMSKLADVIPRLFASCAINCGASSNRGRR